MHAFDIYPPKITETASQPIIFLAGPIQGTDDWQKQAVQYFKTRLPNNSNAINHLIIANPRCPTWHHHFSEQVDWESHYLNLAAQQGVIIFWLAKETTHMCERAYAQTTRFELAEWVTKNPSAVVLGIEDGFPGAKYIRHRLNTLNIYANLTEVCDAAIKQLKI